VAPWEGLERAGEGKELHKQSTEGATVSDGSLLKGREAKDVRIEVGTRKASNRGVKSAKELWSQTDRIHALHYFISYSMIQIYPVELAGTCGCVIVGPPGTVLKLGACDWPRDVVPTWLALIVDAAIVEAELTIEPPEDPAASRSNCKTVIEYIGTLHWNFVPLCAGIPASTGTTAVWLLRKLNALRSSRDWDLVSRYQNKGLTNLPA
jgi:hypothetical protein